MLYFQRQLMLYSDESYCINDRYCFFKIFASLVLAHVGSIITNVGFLVTADVMSLVAANVIFLIPPAADISDSSNSQSKQNKIYTHPAPTILVFQHD